MRYFIKRPGKTRRTFAVVCYELQTRQKKAYLKLPSQLAAVVEDVNTKFLNKTYDEPTAHTLLREAIALELRRAGTAVRAIRDQRLSEANQKLLTSYWRDEYLGRELADNGKAMRYKLEQALRAIEPLSLSLASRSELASKLASSVKDVSRRRAVSDRLNQLLKYAKRDFRLTKPKPAYEQVDYVTEQQLASLVGHFDDSILVSLAWTLFGTGLRLSEALALRPADFRRGELVVDKQLPLSGELKRPKAGKTGTVAVLPQAVKALEAWLAVNDKASYRYKLYDALELACSKAKLGKRIGPHDLRHSHAIYLLERGASLTEVSLQLRNTVSVCQRYYTGFEHTPGTMDRLRRLLGGSHA